MTEATKQIVALARKLDEAFAAGDTDKAKRIAAKQNAVLDAVMGNGDGELTGGDAA